MYLYSEGQFLLLLGCPGEFVQRGNPQKQTTKSNHKEKHFIVETFILETLNESMSINIIFSNK